MPDIFYITHKQDFPFLFDGIILFMCGALNAKIATLKLCLSYRQTLDFHGAGKEFWILWLY